MKTVALMMETATVNDKPKAAEEEKPAEETK